MKIEEGRGGRGGYYIVNVSLPNIDHENTASKILAHMFHKRNASNFYALYTSR